MVGFSHMTSVLMAFFTAEIPVFMLILHMSNRIVKLETQISYLTEAVKK